MKHRVVLAAFAAAFVVACGGGGGGGSGGGTTAEPVSAPPAPVAPTEANIALQAAFSPALVPAGGTTQLSLTITNAGPAAARNLQIYPTWGQGLQVDPASVTCSAAGGATCPAAGATTMPDIPPQGSLVLRATGQVTAGTRGVIAGSVVGVIDNERQFTDNIANTSITAYRADVSVIARGPLAPVLAGSATEYTMTVGNAGPDDARNVRITNAPGPSQSLTGLRCTASGGAVCPSTLGADMTVPVLPANGSLAFAVPVLVDAGLSGSITNAMAVSSAGDPEASNDTASASATAYVTPVVGQTTVTLASDPGDYIGGGLSYAYTRADAIISASVTGGRMQVQVRGDQNWDGEFLLPAPLTQFQPGTYTGLARYPFQAPGAGGLSWTGMGRGCNTSVSSMTVNAATYVAGALLAIDFDFDQHCEGSSTVLHGHVKWIASDATTVPGPVTPAPAGLWTPAAALPAATRSYVYLESEPGDFIGQGRSWTYTRSDAMLTLGVSGAQATVTVNGDSWWSGTFAGMNSLAQLQPGFYGQLQRYPFNNPVRGGLSWTGDGRGCNTSLGWFVIDSVTWNGSAVDTLDLRFEQRCDGQAGVLHGKVHWVAADNTSPPGPITPVPATLWTPPAAGLPATGNYIFLQSDSGDYIGQGQTSTLSSSTTPISAFAGRTAGVTVSGGGWTGNFQGMNSISQLQPGYYPNLQRYPFFNPAIGGLDWSGNGRGCNSLTGWFAVDAASYDSAGLASIDLRFEQHCENGVPALRGKVHWAR